VDSIRIDDKKAVRPPSKVLAKKSVGWSVLCGGLGKLMLVAYSRIENLKTQQKMTLSSGKQEIS